MATLKLGQMIQILLLRAELHGLEASEKTRCNPIDSSSTVLLQEARNNLTPGLSRLLALR
jgi:hypothetical protein